MCRSGPRHIQGRRQLVAGRDPELLVAVREVDFDGSERNEERLCDLAVGHALGHKSGDAELAWGEGMHAGAPYLPANGQTLLELGETDPDQLVLPNLEIAPDGVTGMVKDEVVRDALFADCADDDFAQYVARIVPEPVGPAGTPVKVTPERFGRVPRAYIECIHDRGISLGFQRHMHAATPCAEVISMDTGHMPMYAAPETLAGHLIALAGS